MKKLMGFLMLVAVVVLVAGPASAAYIINTTFEKDSAGAGSWTASTPWADKDIATSAKWVRNTYATIYSGTGACEGTQCGKIYRDAQTPVGARYSKLDFGSGKNTGVIKLTYYAKHNVANDTAPDSGGMTIIRDNAGNVVTQIDMQYDYNADAANVRKIRYMNAAGNMVTLLDGFANLKWYKFEVTLNYNTKKFDITVTNTSDAKDTGSASNQGFRSNLSASFDTIVCVETGQLTDAAAYWDDIKAKVVPKPATTGLLLDADVLISMDDEGRAFDNIMAERLWRSVEYEEVHLWADPRGAGCNARRCELGWWRTVRRRRCVTPVALRNTRRMH